MLMAMELSNKYEGFSENDLIRSKDLIIKANPNLNLKKAFEEKRLIENMSVDKKKAGDKLTFILLKEIGKVKIRTDIAESHIARAIRSLV